MKNYVKALEQAHSIAFTKFNHELVEALETAQNILSNHRNKLSSAQLCSALLTIAVCKTKMDTPDDIMPILEEVEQIAISEGNLSTLVSCLNLQANRMSRTGHFPEAIQKLLYVLEVVQDPQKKKPFINNLGVTYNFVGMYDKALQYLFETLSICEAAGSNLNYMHTCINIGNCYYDQGNFEKSLEYFKAAQNLSSQFPDDSQTLSLPINLALTYARLGDFATAQELLDEAIKLDKLCEFTKNKGSLTYNIGYIHELMGNYETALERYTEALEIVRSTSNPIILTTVLNNMSSVYLAKKDYVKAEEILLEVMELTTEHNLPAQKKECLLQLSNLHRDLQDYPKAFDYLSQYHTVYKSIFNDKVTNGIIKYEADYLTEKTKQKAEIYRLQYVELVEKNAVITQKTQQLETALAQLSESNATKDKLFSIVAHDLRGPVANLQMSLEAMLAEEFSPAEQELMLNLLNEQTKATHELLENLLWWSQAQKESMQLQIVSVHLNASVENIVAIYRTSMAKKGITLSLNLAEDIHVSADKDALSLILRNLIGNAVKFSPLHSTITVAAQILESKLKLDVIDRGSGISPKILKAIQNKAQIHSLPGTAGEKGMGLGLTLCFEFAHKLQGKLSLCKKYKSGTCFTLELPLAEGK